MIQKRKEAANSKTDKQFSISENACLGLSNDMVFQSLGKGRDTVLLSLSSGYIYTCNDTTKAFLEAIDGKKSLSVITEELLNIYDIEKSLLLNDLHSIAGQLKNEGLITIGKSIDE